MSHRFPLAPNGIFNTVQGECSLAGVPMHFVRLAGCSVGCDRCDTDYSVSERLSAAEIVERLQRLRRLPWAWLTGGEPTDHPIGELVSALQGEGYRVALATAGVLEHAIPGDVFGLGGWCILGLFRSWLPTFWRTIRIVLPMVASAGLKRVHIFGVMWQVPLGGLVWLADQYGLSVSTDSKKAASDCTWKDTKRSGARCPEWEDNVA